MRTPIIVLDIAKNVFQVHGVDRSGTTVPTAQALPRRRFDVLLKARAELGGYRDLSWFPLLGP